MFKIVKDIKNSPYKNLKRVFYFGRVQYGCPYFYPRNYVPYFISIKKFLPKFNSNKYFKIGKYYIFFGSAIIFKKHDFSWKDKYNTPRYEFTASKYLFIGPFQFIMRYVPIFEKYGEFFEQYLWYKYYSDENLEKAEKTWGWMRNGVSTWNKDYYEN